jgi:hypothetical protein
MWRTEVAGDHDIAELEEMLVRGWFAAAAPRLPRVDSCLGLWL